MNSTLRILLVDDEEAVLRACARALGEIPGAEVVQQKLSARAVEILRSESFDFDLLITDVRMPGLNGLELLRIAHQKEPSLPVILITGGITPEMLQECVRLEAAACIMKPIRPDRLVATVQSVLEQEREKGVRLRTKR